MVKPKTLLVVLIVASAAAAQTASAQTAPTSSAPVASTSALHSVYLSDIDKSADACTDFFQYANGAWRAANPIPPSMSRWSRRWAAGEQNKEQLKTLLDDLSKRKDWPAGGVDQQITDFYGACMDEAKVNALGAQPIQPLLADIAAMKTAADLQREITALHAMRIYPLFFVGSQPDNHDPSHVIADVTPSGLGLPDRDYYVKPDARFVEAREKYRTHVAKMLELAGWEHAAAAKDADTVLALETRLAQARLERAALRDPAATDHKMTVAELQKSTSAFDWSLYLKALGAAPSDINVDQPAYMQAMQKELVATPIADWRAYLAWTTIRDAAGDLSAPFVDETFAFEGVYLNGAKENKPRWKRCVETEDRLLGEDLGRRYVERYFPPEAKARIQELVKNLLAAMGDTIRGLDWMGAETKQHASRSSPPSIPRSATRTDGRTTARS
jgi:endothelin-converting enzyme/putative endopeptidase